MKQGKHLLVRVTELEDEVINGTKTVADVNDKLKLPRKAQGMSRVNEMFC